MCKKAMSLPEFVAIPENITKIKSYLHYLGSHEAKKLAPELKVVHFLPELLIHRASVEETVKADLRAVSQFPLARFLKRYAYVSPALQKGRILPEDASYMSSLSNSLAPQNMYPPGAFRGDDLARTLALTSGFGGFEPDEDDVENRRLAGRNAEE
jgi:hypothetical protein